MKRPLPILLLLTLAFLLIAGSLLVRMRRHPAVMRQPTVSQQLYNRYIERHELPNPQITPGDTLTTDAWTICHQSTKRIRHVTTQTKRNVYRAYHNPNGNRTGFCDVPEGCEVDHLISLELGGSNDVRNLWPEPYNGVAWNAHIKDRIENALHRDICQGHISAKEAQSKIAANWIAAYCERFTTDPNCPATP